MNNITYFPFERNRYFFGKLLTVGDFEAEQRYINDKRRLINRLLHGTGVVCGLGVVRVDEMEISVDAGVALDSTGREIVVDKPVKKSLNAIDNFSALKEARARVVYLCIEYAEETREPVHTIASDGGSAEGVDYNKIGEGYRLYLTDKAPNPSFIGMGGLSRQVSTLYQDDFVRVTQVLPRYVRSGDEFEYELLVERSGGGRSLFMEFDIALECAQTLEGKRALHVRFDEAESEKASVHTRRFALRASNAAPNAMVFSIAPTAFVIRTGGIQRVAEAIPHTRVELCEGDVGDAIKGAYYRTALDDVTGGSLQQPIVLAKMSLITAVGQTYIIDDLTPMPFGQHILGDVVTSLIDQNRERQLDRLERGMLELRQASPASGGSGGTAQIRTNAAGMLEISVRGLKAGDIVHSEEIAHGLGLGNAFITVGQQEGDREGRRLVFGDPLLFQGFEVLNAHVADLAVVTYPDRGTFRVAARLSALAFESMPLRVHWCAYRDPSESKHDVVAKAVFLSPDLVRLEPRQSFVFEPRVRGIESQKCVFSVVGEYSGEIDPSGRYTAPGHKGVYQIVAKSAADPSVYGVAYAIVAKDQ